MGSYLVLASTPVKADAAFVLAGDMRGHRLKRAAELVRDGYVPLALVSGPMEWYGQNEADMAIAFAVRQGYPREWFEPVHIRSLSTEEEAYKVRDEFIRRGIKRLILVTSNYHTRRTGTTFRRIMPRDIEITVVAASDEYFDPHSWWKNREGRKTAFIEMSKTVASWIGL